MAVPGFVDFVVVVGLSLILCYLMRILKRISESWKEAMRNRIKAAMAKRKLVKDPFRNTYGYSWDYVMVFKVTPFKTKMNDKQKESSIKFIIGRMTDAGLENRLFYSVQRDEVYCKIRCALPRLLDEADRVNYKLLLEPAVLCNTLRTGNEKGPIEKQWKGVEIPTRNIETEIDPYEYIYCEYRSGEDPLYKHWPNDSVLRGVDRLKLIASILKARLSDGGAFLDVYRLIKNKCMITFFPLHDAVELRELEERWLRMCQPPWLQHIDPVKDYFGEKIGLFFLFLGHYTTWLIPAMVVGFFVWINVSSDNNNPDAIAVPYFAAFVSVWSTLFLEFWKRKEKTKAMKWGMVGFEDTEQDRPEFDGEPSISPVDGSKMLYFPSSVAYYRLGITSTIITALIMFVIGCVIVMIALRLFLTGDDTFIVAGVATGGIIAGIANAVLIQVLNAAYSFVAIRLTEYENHRTDTEYEDFLIGKTFVFQFVNSFASLFYLAFVKPYNQTLDPCIGSCMVELQAGLGTIFLTRLATGSILKLAIPYITQKMKFKSETKGVDPDDLTDVELAYIQAEYHVILGPFLDYANLAIQFGYATMFIAAYPLAMAASFLANYVEMRVDAWKLTQQSRRPDARSAEDIGTWYTILEVISYAAVVTNSGLVAFTGSFVENYTWTGRVWVFCSMAGALIYIKYLFAEYIDDIPRDVEIQLERQDYYLSKVLHNIPDEDDMGLTEGVDAKIKYTIRVNDDDPL
mmetsp:Transcript_16737/g.28381  ORF Transcript_16737/g.28381 Transcript_16737/m.28381 type:complete len:742 (+) Transcript_16737:144-2369(+)|eukprot:CAMPEP_0174979346 /NCGR_PEP_ID=MMETSP0004_2-20121128/14720_1 /TAXON_ID=420556 /ORGANISM="Ochromonas sp., Strain CCMP1393" /LENGTH=741 /DNA_ID=CAMNT_0016230843 /DNA_START=37 /DNA_END=2262 /DNA_ORIENTATION=-